jgi:hypothetical protein
VCFSWLQFFYVLVCYRRLKIGHVNWTQLSIYHEYCRYSSSTENICILVRIMLWIKPTFLNYCIWGCMLIYNCVFIKAWGVRCTLQVRESVTDSYAKFNKVQIISMQKLTWVGLCIYTGHWEWNMSWWEARRISVNHAWGLNIYTFQTWASCKKELNAVKRSPWDDRSWSAS